MLGELHFKKKHRVGNDFVKPVHHNLHIRGKNTLPPPQPLCFELQSLYCEYDQGPMLLQCPANIDRVVLRNSQSKGTMHFILSDTVPAGLVCVCNKSSNKSFLCESSELLLFSFSKFWQLVVFHN